MNASTIYQQIFMSIPNARMADILQTLNMFCLEHNIKGNTELLSIDLSTATIDIITMNDAVQLGATFDIQYTDQWVNEVNALTIDSSISNVKQVIYNSRTLIPVSFAELRYCTAQAYFVGDENRIYFNFDVDRTLDLDIYYNNLTNTIAKFGDNWTGLCVRYCLKELFSKPAYFNETQYQLNMLEYDRLRRIVHKTNRGKPYLRCMERDL